MAEIPRQLLIQEPKATEGSDGLSVMVADDTDDHQTEHGPWEMARKEVKG
jgi:hypothetical protein